MRMRLSLPIHIPTARQTGLSLGTALRGRRGRENSQAANRPNAMHRWTRILFFLLCVAAGGAEAEADLRVFGSASNLELMSNLVIAFGARTGITIDLRGPGSVEGIHSLLAGRADMAFISRPLSEQRRFPYLVATPYCLDAVVVVVHPANPVISLSRTELNAIFSGDRLHWEDGTGVVVLIRDGFSGTRQLFQEKIMHDETFSPAYVQTEKRGEGMMLTPLFSTFHPPFFPLIRREEEMLFSLAKIRGAIAYLSIGHIPKEARIVNIDGVAPVPRNVKSGKYVLSRTPLLVTRGKPRGEARKLTDFILSPAGQKIVARVGYIPIGAVAR